jgi:ATPase subunit of ABC transporter with duplicated ATPase domains
VLTLENVQKRLDSGRLLFKDVSLSFYQGAKIGVLGANGSGKSSLLKIIAGVDKEFDGSTRLTDSTTRVGYLQQEPDLDYDKTVGENILDGVGHKRALLERYDEISAEFCNEDADFDALMAEQTGW